MVVTGPSNICNLKRKILIKHYHYNNIYVLPQNTCSSSLYFIFGNPIELQPCASCLWMLALEMLAQTHTGHKHGPHNNNERGTTDACIISICKVTVVKLKQCLGHFHRGGMATGYITRTYYAHVSRHW